MKISICHTSLEHASKNMSTFYFDVLAPLACIGNTYKVINDSNGHILDSYKKALMEDNTGMLSHWMETLTSRGKLHQVDNQDDISSNIHINSLANTYDTRVWLSNDSNDYQTNVHKISDYGIQYVHCNDATYLTSPHSSSPVFVYQELTKLLIDQLCIMMDRKQSHKLEDIHNDALATRLEQDGYIPLDQTRRGVTGTAGNPGELDILVKSNSNVKVSIIEALRESSCGPANNNISSHLNKLLNDYDTCGLKVNYLITYCEAVNFGNFWDNYVIYMNQINAKSGFSSSIPQISFTDTNTLISNFSEIRVGRGVYNRNGRELEVYHIVCNMYVRNSVN